MNHLYPVRYIGSAKILDITKEPWYIRLAVYIIKKYNKEAELYYPSLTPVYYGQDGYEDAPYEEIFIGPAYNEPPTCP